MNRVLLIRHGATAGNLERRYIGRTDQPLCPAGEEQARRLAALRPEADFLFASPMLRARQTAALAFPGQSPVLDGDLAETDFGLFEGKTAAELSGDPAYARWLEAQCIPPPPGGESAARMKARCLAAFDRCMARVPEGASAAFVIHGGGIMAILEARARPAGSFYDFHVANGVCVACRHQNGVLVIEARLEP